MSGVPDYTLEDVLDFKFTTRQFSTGAPFAFAGGVIEIYEDNDTAQIIGAETLTLEFDGVTGLHNLRVAATAANGFENGKSYQCVVSVGTVDSVSVVGEVVQQFSIGRSAAAVDLANGTDGLGAIKAETANILTDTAEIGAAGAGLTAINLPNQTMDITGNITGNLSGSVGSVTGSVGSLTGHTNQTGDTFVLANGASGFVATKAETALIVADTNELQTDWVNGGRLDNILDARMAEASIATTGGAVDTVTTLTGHTAQTGDNFARIGAAGASLTDLGGMSTGMKAEVNAEALDVLNTDTFAESSGIPAATSTLVDKITWLFTLARNKGTQTATTKTLRNDVDSGNIATSAISDDGTTFTRDEWL